MAEDTIVITIRDRDPLLVRKQRLVESSSVFSYIILECNQSEHEITDFAPEMVEMFLTLLEDKKMEQIEELDFRELHKIAVVFNVEWLIKSCRQWLLEKINNVGDAIDYESLLFFLDECCYIYSKWNLTRFMETLILKVRFKDNSLFLSRYIRENYDQLSTGQLKFLLHLAGSKTKVFLELIIERINSQEYLDDRTRYLLKHMNLSLCVKQNEQLYHEMSGRLPELSGMSKDDFRLVLRLTTEATKDASDRKNNTSSVTTVFDLKEELISPHIVCSPFVSSTYSYGGTSFLDNNLFIRCRSLLDIARIMTKGKIRSMCTVIEILGRVAYHNILSAEEIEEFVVSLENFSHSKTLQKVSTRNIDMMINALEYSDNERKHQFIKLLEMIRNSEQLSSCYNEICLEGKKITQSNEVESAKNVLELKNSEDRYVFRMKHREVTDCKRSDDCGFVIRRYVNVQEYNVKYELSKEAGDYTNSGVHLHDVIRADHMNWYRIRTGTTREGAQLRAPARWWKKWFPGVVINCELTEYCVDYKIGDSLIAKY